MVVTNRNIVHNYCWVWPRQQEVDNVRNVPSNDNRRGFHICQHCCQTAAPLGCKASAPAVATIPALSATATCTSSSASNHGALCNYCASKQQHQHSAVGQMGRWLAMGGGNGCRLVPGTSCVKGLEAQSKLAAKAAIPAVPNQQRSGTCTTAVANLCCDWYTAPVHACGYL